MWTRTFRAKSTHYKRNYSLWDFKKLRNSSALGYNIPACGNEQPIPHFCEPRAVLFSNCTNPESIFEDLIISSHKNRSAQLQEKPFFSFMVSARPLVGKQFLQKMHRVSSRLITAFHDDQRIRVGLTATYDDTEGQDLLFHILETIHATTPIADNLTEIFTPFTRKEFIETPALQSIPFDKHYNPPYFFNSSNTFALSTYFGHYQEDDAIIPQELPLIHQAILNNDQQTVAQLLSLDPELASKKDPIGVMAHHLAYHLGPADMFALFVEARKKYPPKSRGDAICRPYEDRQLAQWKASGLQILDDKIPFARQLASVRNRASYKEELQSSATARSSLHLASIAGDLNLIGEILKAEPGRINEQDSRGYTPILLAAANGHAKSVRWLINQGASIKVSFHPIWLGYIALRLSDHAETPEVMQAILKGDASQAELSGHLIAAIKNNNIRLARYLSCYLTQWPCEKNGLSALKIAIDLSHIHGTEMLETLLMNHDKPFPQGPYDTDLYEYLKSITDAPRLPKPDFFNVNPAVIPLLEAHNKKYANRENAAQHKVKLIYDLIEDNQIISKFVSDNLQIIARMKRVQSLTLEERQAIHALFFQNFEMFYDNTEQRQQDYLSHALEDCRDRPAYIQLFYHENTLIAFMTFEFFSLENTLVFHGKLGANRNEAPYTSQKLVSLVFRMAVVAKLLAEEQKVLVFCKAIFPGLGASVTLPYPKDMRFYPKLQCDIHEDLVKKIVQATGESMQNDTILAKLRVKGRTIDKTNSLISLFNDLTGGQEKNAMPLCFEINGETMAAYMKLFQKHNIDAIAMKNFSVIWDEFRQIVEGSDVRAGLRLQYIPH